MAPYDDTTAATRFDTFSVYETHFKQIGDHKINVAILVPKDLKPGKVPLAVKFHGGGLVSKDIPQFQVQSLPRYNSRSLAMRCFQIG
ncbi:hypothetical protein PMIN06_001959 [Paraphaeosphaeria minitans]